MAFPKYDSYKDSGVDWLGEIPSHWSIRRNKYLFSERDERRGSDEIKHYALSKYLGLVPHSDATDKEARADSLDNYKKFQLDDLVMNKMQAWNGIFGYATSEGVVSPDYTVFQKIDDINVKFYEFLYKTSLYIGQFLVESRGMGDAFKRLHTPRFGAIHAIYPQKDEQDRIVNFLTHKTAEIDEAIAKKQRLIELLQDQKAILINQAVTKGLNPKVLMRDSGVEWIGEIPEHWEIKRAKHLFQAIVDTEHKTAPSFDTEEYLIVRTSNVRDGKLRLENALYTNEKIYQQWTRRAIPEAGDILFTREAPAGEACILPPNTKALIGQRMVLMKVNSEALDARFAVFSIYGGAGKQYINNLSIGSTVPHFNMSDIKNIPIIAPDLIEQRQISQHLETIVSEVDSGIDKELQGISVLEEFKLCLISNVVTGKIKI